jgi:hypothetical protein
MKRCMANFKDLKRLAAVTGAAALCLVLAAAGCSHALAGNTTPVTTDSPAADGVVVTYFYSPKTAASIHLATEWIIETVEDGYPEQIAQNELSLVGVNADDPGNEAVLEQYGAQVPSLYISTTTGGVTSTKKVEAIWLYLDDTLEDTTLKAKFESMLRSEVDVALGIPDTVVPDTTAPADTGVASLEVMVLPSSYTESLDIAVIAYNSAGEIVSVSGALSIKLWHREGCFTEELGELLQQWDGMPLGPDNFVSSIGNTMSLPYHDFRPHSASLGWLQVTLTTAGGQTVSTEVTPIQVRRPLGCCEEE